MLSLTIIIWYHFGTIAQMVGSPCTSTPRRSTPSAGGSGRRPVRLAQAQKNAVVELSAPAMAAMRRGLWYCEAMPAADIETIITDHCMDSIVANTRPRYSF